jgi:arabinose-5-phosphate isomerase
LFLIRKTNINWLSIMVKNSSKSALDLGRETILMEAAVLVAVADALAATTDFESAVAAMAACRGRIVVTGVGKSAIIAQKMVATFNSTGTPALFLHAADAVHGDLGMVLTDDLVVCLSRSGATPEIQLLVPFLKKSGNTLVAVTAERDAYLARQADFLLFTPVDQEADPNNLAPTSSTTAQMAVGDALAVCLMARRGFSPNDFARVHPGGALGRQLNLRVGDLAERHDKPRVGPDATLPEVILEMTSKRLGATAVTNAQDEILGIITDGDLRRMLAATGMPAGVCAKDIMGTAPKTMEAGALAVEALALMRQHAITQVLAVAAGKYAGMVHLHDLLREGLV